jgi:hypothetical protein
MAEVEVEHTLAATVNAAELCTVAEPHHFVGETALLEEFERARLDAGGAGCRGRSFTLVDEAYRHPHARQFQRSRQACRPRANDQDRIRHDITQSGSRQSDFPRSTASIELPSRFEGESASRFLELCSLSFSASMLSAAPAQEIDAGLRRGDCFDSTLWAICLSLLVLLATGRLRPLRLSSA